MVTANVSNTSMATRDNQSKTIPPGITISRPIIEYWATSDDGINQIAGLCRIHKTLQASKFQGHATPSYPHLTLSTNTQNPRTESIKQAIREYCSRAKDLLVNSPSSFIMQANAQAQVTGSGAQYWNAIKQAIYLSKLSRTRQAMEAQNEATALASEGVFAIPSLDSIREVLTTLSPVNTAVWPDLRVLTLEYLITITTAEFNHGHQVTVVMDQLLHDGGDQQVSEDALKFMVEECTNVLTEYHTVTVRAQLALVKLLRRSRAYYDAACKAVKLLQTCVRGTSLDSVWSRMVARELAHIFKAIGHPEEADKIAREIVVMHRLQGSGDVVLHNDECAIYTMEDIAENFDTAGDFEESAKWLALAAKNGWELWKGGLAMQHIVDKLERVSKACRRPDYANDWMRGQGGV
jgi:hypothetical protein